MFLSFALAAPSSAAAQAFRWVPSSCLGNFLISSSVYDLCFFVLVSCFAHHIIIMKHGGENINETERERRKKI